MTTKAESAPTTPHQLWKALGAKEQKAVEAYSKRYIDFLKEAVCSPWTAKAMIEQAEKSGFKAFPTDGKAVKPGDRFYFNQDYQSVALVVIGENNPVISGFNIVGAHMDSPQLELKPNTLLESAKGMTKLKTKPHGGGLWSTWENRRLGLAGRVFMPLMKDGKPKTDPANGRPLLKETFVRVDRPIGSITLPAIHLSRKLNKEHPINEETDLNPLISLSNNEVVSLLKKETGMDLAEAERAELYLFPTDPPSSSGVDNSMIHAQGHDDRSMCYAALEAIIEAGEIGKDKGKTPPKATSIAFFFEDEEVGSRGRGGANGNWASIVAGEIVTATRGALALESLTQARDKALNNSFILSADVTHAWDENHNTMHDSKNAVHMGLGPVIKMDSGGSYATTPETATLAMALFKKADVPYQVVSSRQNIPCGSTIGGMIASQTTAKVVDMGPAILSMHSIEEIGSKTDFYLSKKAFASFFKG